MSCKDGHNKGQKWYGPTEAEDIKRWQEYTEELHKKDLHDQDNHYGMITHLQPDILECKVKWALESITTNKASGGDGIPVELFQILKDDAMKVLHSIYVLQPFHQRRGYHSENTWRLSRDEHQEVCVLQLQQPYLDNDSRQRDEHWGWCVLLLQQP